MCIEPNSGMYVSQIIRAVACLPEVDQSLVTALANMTEKAVKNSAARPADTQQLAKHLARLLINRAKVSYLMFYFCYCFPLRRLVRSLDSV